MNCSARILNCSLLILASSAVACSAAEEYVVADVNLAEIFPHSESMPADFEWPRIQVPDESNVATEIRVAAGDSIQVAVDRAVPQLLAGQSVRILIAPGIYRETIDIADLGNVGTLIIEAETPGSSIISGSDVFVDWELDDSETGVFAHDWPYDFGWEPNPWKGLMPMTTPGFRHELLFLNGEPQVQVLSAEAMRDGTYWVDEDADQIYFNPPGEVDLAEQTVEISVRPLKSSGAHSKLLRVWKSDNIVLRGLIFQHGMTRDFTGAVQFLGSSNLLIEDCQMILNSSAGLLVNAFSGRPADNVVIRNVDTSRNGFIGLTGGFHNGWIENNRSNYNNWRGVLFGATGWAPCGWKLSHLHRVVIKDSEAIGNHASGAWLDDEISHIWMENFTGAGNFRSGLSTEAVMGPLVIRGADLYGNSVGLNLFDSQQVALIDSILIDNHQAQIRYAGSTTLTAEELKVYPQAWRRNRLSKRQVPTQLTVRNSLLAVSEASSSARLFQFGMREHAYRVWGEPMLQPLVDTLSLVGLIYAHPNGTEAPAFPDLENRATDYAAWVELTGSDHGHWDVGRAEAAAVSRQLRYMPPSDTKPVGPKPVSNEVDDLEL